MHVHSNEPVDIWNINNNSTNNDVIKDSNESENLNNTVLNGIEKIESNSIDLEDNINNEKNYLVGLFDPADNDLALNMWELSDGDKIIKIINKIDKINLSKDAQDLYDKLILTNALPPKNNFENQEFVKLKTNWLIKKNDLNLINQFIQKNKNNVDDELLKHYLNQNLSDNNLNKGCEIFSNINLSSSDPYISKFKIYCLIHKKNIDVAQIQFDLLKENGFSDNFFENKFNFLVGYSDNTSTKISEESILNFHISHKTNTKFEFIPNEKTDKLIWRYLRNNNLLAKLDDIDIEDDEKITLNVLKLSNNIIALGGGAFLNEKIRSKVLKNNHSIWLNWENQTLISRLYKSKKRPITYNLKRKDLNNLINKRSKIYSMANYKINCDKLSKNEIINKILKIYEK